MPTPPISIVPFDKREPHAESASRASEIKIKIGDQTRLVITYNHVVTTGVVGMEHSMSSPIQACYRHGYFEWSFPSAGDKLPEKL